MDINRHLDDDEIESYSLHSTTEASLARVEEHLLICPSCQQRVESSDEFVRSMQQASAQIRREPQAARPWFSLPRFAFALAACAVLVCAVLLFSSKSARESAPFAISLSATRGAAIEAKAPQGKPLSLQLDLAGLPAAGSYRLEMVDPAGKPVWTGVYPGATVKPVSAGVYFVRLYSSAGDLLREYGLEIEAAR